MLLSGAVAMPNGCEEPVGIVVSPETPEVMSWFPTWLPLNPTNQTEPSPRSTKPIGPSLANGVANSLNEPVVVTRPILLPANSVNHRLPSFAPMIPIGPDAAVGMGNSVTTPAGVIRATAFPGDSVNHMLPSLPAAIHWGLLVPTGIENW